MESAQKKWWILFAMCLLTVMLNIDATAINVAIPAMASDYKANLASMQWVINAYLLMSAMFQILGARLGDTYGHRKMFLIGTVLFVLSSAGAGLAPDEGIMILFRTLQGLALGLAYPMTIVLTLGAFPKGQQGFALSFIVATMGISLAIGPPVGGFFVDTIGWRWIFYINVPLGILTYAIAALCCPSHKSKERRTIDYPGAALLVLGLFGVMLAINQVQQWGFGSIAIWASFILGSICLTALYFFEKTKSYPIIEFDLFKKRNFLFNCIIRLILQLIFIPYLFFIPIYLINISGYGPIKTGLLMLFMTVVIGVASPIAGKWVDRIGDKIPNIVSMILCALACWLLSFLERDPNLYLLGSGLALIGVGVAIIFVSTVTGCVAAVTEKQHAAASGIIFTIAWFGCAFGIALLGSIIALTSKQEFVDRFSLTSSSLSTVEFQAAERVCTGIDSYTNLSAYFSGSQLSEVTYAATESFIKGFQISQYFMLALCLLGLLLALFLKKHKPTRAEISQPIP